MAVGTLNRTQSMLREVGYVRFRLGGELPAADLEQHLSELRREFNKLPADPYGGEGNRFRRYSRAVLMPWSGHLEWIPNAFDEDGKPAAEYFQGAYNPDYRQTPRRFPAISERSRANPLLRRAIEVDFEQTFWDDVDSRLPLHVGVHFVKLQVDAPGDEAVASPNHLHQDGEPFTFAHLVERRNSVGGVNTIAKPRCSGLLPEDVGEHLILDRFELVESLDSYGVCDAKVSHYVSAVRRANGHGPAARSVVLIDFTPMVPRI
jgi:hypothetical protein